MKCTMTHDCHEPAVASYVWPWGEEGLCCATHRPLLAQVEKNTKRRVSLAMLNPGAPLPMTHDERVAHHAQRLALEEELSEARARGVELHKAHQDLVRQLRTAQAQIGTLEAAAKVSDGNRAELERELARVRAELGHVVEDLQRERALNAPTADAGLPSFPR